MLFILSPRGSTGELITPPITPVHAELPKLAPAVVGHSNLGSQFMPYRELEGNLFASQAQALVNTVNCVGFMGKGVALEFRRRFPAMFEEYRQTCLEGRLRPGQILPFRKSEPWVLNFAIKNDWKHPARVEWIEECLSKFRENYRYMGLLSVAFPWMGAMNGGIPLSKIQEITRRYLADIEDLDISVYSFDPEAEDPLFHTLKERSRLLDSRSFARESGLRPKAADIIYGHLADPNLNCWSDVLALPGLGEVALSHLYSYLSRPRRAAEAPRELF